MSHKARQVSDSDAYIIVAGWFLSERIGVTCQVSRANRVFYLTNRNRGKVRDNARLNEDAKRIGDCSGREASLRIVRRHLYFASNRHYVLTN